MVLPTKLMRNIYLLSSLLLLFFLAGTHTAYAQIILLDSFEAKMKLDSEPQLIDARSPEEFALNHLNGSINIDTKTPGHKGRIAALHATRPVFIYAINETRSLELASILQKKGFPQVYILKGGIGGWIGNGKQLYSSTNNTFSQSDLDNLLLLNKTVLVDLHIRYCPVCKKLQPIVDSLSLEFGDALKVIRIDVYDNPAIAGNFKINSVPALIAYDNGQVIYRKAGPDIEKAEIEGILTNAVISR